MSSTKNRIKPKAFTSYQAFVIAILAILQFTVVLDFMVLSPLGAILLDKLSIQASQFGLVVSAYAFSAGISGLLTAGFADKFDRKKLLLFFYLGFILGTLLCALAPNYHLLLIARIVTGLFGGVMSSISFAIITDLFQVEVRGRVMGFVQMAFSGSQVLGIPIGLALANAFGWHAPFWMITGFSMLVAVCIFIYLKPIDAHLHMHKGKNPLLHLFKTVSQKDYLLAFSTTTLLAAGGFMLMPFASAFTTNNLGITIHQLPLLYGITGVSSMLFGPFIGRLSDKMGKYRIFVIGSIIAMMASAVYCNLGITPLYVIAIINVIMFVGVSSRIISASALMTSIPTPQDRGAFMSINSSVQQLSGGIAATVAGLIVVKAPSGRIEHYDTLAYVVIGAMIVTIGMMYVVNGISRRRTAAHKPLQATPSAIEQEILMEVS